ncbi:uncharacterized protein IL334_002153 [Kwoniella shivajii]|uniref:RRM domain-containing protein n=1 Tax=Kwoniella shivajii TaxID=564305 RepID=A0ABZ1CVI8_9TREE|nr:hypothetical protein IL334_002153 [Kwoniella shivajii]
MADANDLYKDDLYGDLDLEDLDDASQLEELVEPPELEPATNNVGGPSTGVPQSNVVPNAPAPVAAATTSQPNLGNFGMIQQQDPFGNGGAGAGGDPALERIRPSDMPDEGKMFIGGLNWETTDDGLKAYMAQYGEIEACTIMRDLTGRSRGFAFLTYKTSEAVNKVLAQTHTLDGKQIDPKRAIPRAEHERTAKVFVGGLAPSVTGESLRTFLTQFGEVMDATVMFDKETSRSKGFAFATFADEDSVQRAMNMTGIELEGKQIEIKKAQPRGAGTQPGKFSNQPNNQMGGGGGGGGQQQNRFQGGGGNMNNNGFNGGGMGGMGFNPAAATGGLGGGFDPNAMAMMYQNMMKNNGMGSMMPGFDPSSMAMMYQNMMKTMAGNSGGVGVGGNAPAINPNMAMRNGMGGMGMGGMGMGGMGMGGMGMGGMGMMGMNGMGMGGGNMGMGGAGGMGRGMNQNQARPVPNAPRGPAAMRSGPSTGGPSSGQGGNTPTGPGAQRYSTQGSARAKPY